MNFNPTTRLRISRSSKHWTQNLKLFTHLRSGPCSSSQRTDLSSGKGSRILRSIRTCFGDFFSREQYPWDESLRSPEMTSPHRSSCRYKSRVVRGTTARCENRFASGPGGEFFAPPLRLSAIPATFQILKFPFPYFVFLLSRPSQAEWHRSDARSNLTKSIVTNL